ncbi:MAG: amino acid adenylation domain-containing protein [Thermoanaerobaculia bacterium]
MTGAPTNVLPAAPPTTDQGFQLSPQQRRAWSLLKASGGSGFLVQGAWLLTGDLDPAALRQALESVVARHEILRTVYRQIPGLTDPVQVIAEPAVEWLRVTAEEDPGALLLKIAGQPFDLASGPVLRATLQELSPGRHALLLTLPALCADLLSMANLARELAAALQPPDDPGPDPVQYADVSEVLNDLLIAEDTADGRSYWRSWDPASVEAPRLPFSTPAPPGSAFWPLVRELFLEPGLEERLLRAAGVAGIDVEDFLLAAWRIFLEKRTGEGGITVGVAFAGRRYEGLDEALGLFARSLPVAVGLADDPSFAEAARRIAEARSSLAEWQEFFEWPEEGGFFPFLFDFDRDPGPLTAGSLTISPRLRRAVLERFHLRLAAGSLGERLTLALAADPEVVPAATLERLATGFQALLAAAIKDPLRPGSHLPALGEAEERELLTGFNRTAAPYPADRSVAELIAEQARRSPGRVAVEAGDRRLTYAELDALADRLADRLSQAGAGPEQTVALLAERSPETLVALLGILKAGAAFLPLDSFQPTERLAAILADARPRLILAHDRLTHRLPVLPVETLSLDGALEADPAPSPCAPVVVGPQQLAYVIYTSGSTGRPKGVMVPHQGLTNYLSWCRDAYSLAPGSVVPVHSPLGFDLTLTSLFAPLLAGGTVLIIPEADGIEALSSLLAGGREYNLVKLTPAHLDGLRHLPDAFATAPRLRSVILGGEALRGESLSQWRASSPSMRIFNEYGPTETVVGCSVYELPPGPPAPGPVPIGRPIANAALYLLDASFAPVPPGTPGELYVGGDGVARGYSGLPGLTAERFVPDPFDGRPGRRLYRTGDLAALDQEGELVYLGRRDHQVKIRGFRIELGEIEAAAGRQPGVLEAVVTATLGSEGQRRLVCYVVLGPGEELRAPGLREALERELPRYMVPSSFVILPSLPLTSNGKVDRSALPPPDERGKSGSTYEAPRNETEKLLAELWAEFLKLDRVGIHDNFFELGGDSILALQVVSRAQRAGVRLVPRQVFQHQTVAALAAAAGSVSGPEEQQGTVVGPVPLTPIQRRFFEQVTVDLHHYNQSLLLALHQVGSPASWERALCALAAHHDALRLRFTPGEDGWRQECLGLEVGIPLAWIDLSAVPAAGRGAAIESAAAALQGSLDLTRGPLTRVAVFDSGPGESGRILLVIHHLLTDAVSWHVVLEDLEALLLGFERGEEPRLPAKATSFQRWAGLLAGQAQSPETAAELDYWAQATWHDVSPLPQDRAGENDEASADIVSASLEPEETRAFLQEMPERFQVGAGQALLAAFASALARWAPGTTVGIDLEGHGRDNDNDEIGLPVDLTRTVGWFTTLYPMLVDLSEIDGPTGALRQIDRRMREVPRQGIGYGLLRFGGAAAVRLRELPQPEMVFNYLGRLGTGAASALFGAAGESVGPTKSPRQRRSHVLEVNAAVAGDRLRVALIYSRGLHRRESIEALATDILKALRALLAGPSETALDDERLSHLLENVEFEI